MNYACVLLSATCIFSVVYWYASGRYHYIGPRVQVELVGGIEVEASGKVLVDGPPVEKET